MHMQHVGAQLDEMLAKAHGFAAAHPVIAMIGAAVVVAIIVMTGGYRAFQSNFRRN